MNFIAFDTEGILRKLPNSRIDHVGLTAAESETPP
jgi:hypothetical protein